MKTTNLELELMTIGQQNKEVFINETLGSLDSLSVKSVKSFIAEPPKDEDKNFKFIITAGEFANHICYCSFQEKKWRYLKPKLGMVFYCLDKGCFVFFDGRIWGDISNEKEVIPPSFSSLRGEVEINSKNNFFYIEGDSTLKIRNLTNVVTDIIFKQNAARNFNVNFNAPILWQNGVAYRISSMPNLIDHIRLTKLPETEHFLGEVVSKGYRY